MAPIEKQPAPQLEQTLRRSVTLALVYLLLATQALLPVDDPDIWWHLRTGQWIVQHGSVPLTDPFSIYGVGKPWVAYSWLFDVIIYQFFVWFGLAGIVWFTVLLALSIALAMHGLVRSARMPWLQEIAITAIAMVCIKPLMSPRPWLFSILFFAIELTLLLRFRRFGKLRDLYPLPVIFSIWANFHVQFLYGLALLMIFILELYGGQLLGAAKVEPVNPESRGSRHWFVAITACCVLGTLVNPYHIRIYKPIVDYIAEAKVFDFVMELQSPSFRQPEDWVFLILVIAAVFICGWRREKRLFSLGVLVLGMLLSFRARRDIWVAAVTTIGVITYWERPKLTPYRLTWICAGLAAFIVVPTLFYVARYRQISDNELWRHVSRHFPMDAVNFISQRQISGPLYNHFNWGGFLIWSLPNLPVGIDGRTNVYGKTRIEQNLDSWLGRPSWKTDPDLAQANVIVGPVDLPLTELLKIDPRFRLCYADRIAAVFVRAAQSNAAPCE